MGLLDTLMSGGYGSPDDEEEKKRRRMFGGMEDPAQTYGKIEQPKPPSWDEGGKFTWKDGLALALTGVGDAFTREGGGQGGAMSEMIGRAMNARAASRKAQIDAAKEEEKTQRFLEVTRLNNIPDEQAYAQLYGVDLPKPAEPPPMQRDLDTFNSWDEQQKANYAAMQMAKNAGMFRGEDGLMYPNQPLPNGGLDPSRFVPIDEKDVTDEDRRRYGIGGAGSPAPRPFPVPRFR